MKTSELGEAAAGDPFLAEEALLTARATLDQVHDQMAAGDRALFAEAQKSIEAANRQLVAAGRAGPTRRHGQRPGQPFDRPGNAEPEELSRDLSVGGMGIRAWVISLPPRWR